MMKCRTIFYKLLIVLISVFLIDGGKSLLIVSNNLQVIINKDHTNDLEIPDQHNHLTINTDKKCIESFKFDFSGLNDKSTMSLFALDITSQEFLNSIWQPPEFV
jgi:hypothetical protein